MVKTTGSPPIIPRLPPSGAHSARRLNKPNYAVETTTTSSKPPPCSVALCKTETVLLSATGDILVCRCRESSKAYQPAALTRAQNVWMDKAKAHGHGQNANEESGWDALSVTCSEIADHYSENLCPCNVDDSKHIEMEIPQYVSNSRRGGLLGGAAPLADQIDHTESSQPMYAQQHPMNPRRGGLLGGAPREGDASEIDASSVSSEVQQHQPLNKPITVVTTESPGEGSLNPASSFEEADSLMPIPSFDYSHFARGGNDMAPNTPARPISMLPAVPESTDEAGKVKKIDISNNLTPTSIPNLLDEAPIQNPRIGIVASKNEEEEVPAGPMLMHGVPTFLPSLSQIRVSQVSAHPRGSHVLLISSDALLFAYGLNTNGQLGIGKKSKAKSSRMGFVTNPTIVTPLLENGGKTIACAAGVDHSLVVVKTDETRVGSWRQRRKSSTNNPISLSRSHSLPAGVTEDKFDADSQSSQTNEASGNAQHQHYHHQLYGFGNNTNMALGLANPNSTRGQKGEDVLLPRRVALHCKVWPDTTGGPPAGIFQIAASDKHSAALVRRASGAVELYTWGDASQGALGLDLSDVPYEGKASDIISCPTVVESMSYVPPSFDEHKSEHGNMVSQSLSTNEYPAQVALGPDCTFVVSSSGTCTVFGTSEDGLLGLGQDITSALEPTTLPLPASGIKSISVGGSHAVALTEDGNAYLWGSNSHGKLAGVLPDPAETATSSEDEMRLETSMESEGPILLEGSDGSWVPIDGPESEQKKIVWTPHPVEIFNDPITKRSREWKRVSSDRDLRLKRSPSNQSEEPSNAESQQADKVKLSQVCAGHDSTVFVTNEGRVLSCGQQSGRLGIGEVNDDVVVPRPMFGGLRLWHEPQGNNHEQ